jgi:hypothetical protein
VITTLPVGLGTFLRMTHYAIKKKKIGFFIRLILAAFFIAFRTILEAIHLGHLREGHGFNGLEWESVLINSLTMAYPLSVIPTLLYTWQCYDVMAYIACQTQSCFAQVLRTLVTVTYILGYLVNLVIRIRLFTAR